MKDKKLLELVRKASKQNKDAFNELCNLKAREVIYLCVVEMGNQHDGEDAAQEVFIRMQKSISSLQAPEAFNVWLNRLVHNTCVNMKRDTMKHKSSIPFETFEDAEWQDDSLFSLPQAFMEDAEKRALVAEAVEALPEKYRRCVVLHYYQSLNYEQVAEVLGITTDAVNNNLRMARKYLKIELEERMRDPMPAAWAALPLVASGPVLALSLQESAVASISSEMIAGCLAAAGVPAVAAGQAAAGKSAMQTVLKVLAPVVATG
ncbi:RNA polymerase sigma factor, partial [Ruminococcaceae bacterium OttesenSCG-928-D13]|nr:RNA polymerase sigma factor [Ruminococcaceae bacterium OttesenSCG-928-D13]